MKRFKTLFIGLILLFILLYWWTHRWSYIVIHHSAGEYGNIEFLQKVHRERQSRDLIDAIPYHYIIGNGKGLGVGVVKSDWRKSWHIWGMYVSRHNKDRNFRGLGICLIGNFENHGASDMQYRCKLALISCFKLVSSWTTLIWPYISFKSIMLISFYKFISKYWL